MSSSRPQLRTLEEPPALISVVIPVRNGEAHIVEQLEALAGQSYRGAWELIVVDNGCRDRTIAIVESFRSRLPSLVIVNASGRRGLGRARNAGASAARGDLLAYCDADDVAAPDWLQALADGAGQGDIVGGSNDFEALNNDLQRAWERVRPMTSLNSGYAFLPYPSGGNCAIWAHVAREIAWDERFMFGASDIEFAWRAQLAGYRLAFVPDAVMRIRFRTHPVSIGRQHFRYGMSEPYLFRRFREQGMPPRDLAKTLRSWRWLARNAVSHLANPEDRGDWFRRAGASAGRLYGSLRWRVVYF